MSFFRRIGMANFGGGGGGGDTQIVTVGTSNLSTIFYYGWGDVTLAGGSTGTGTTGSPMGSINDGTSNIFSGAIISCLSHGGLTPAVRFVIEGLYPNSGFTTMKVGATSYDRASVTTYSQGSDYTSWVWNTATNPFGTTNGVNITVTWT